MKNDKIDPKHQPQYYIAGPSPEDIRRRKQREKYVSIYRLANGATAITVLLAVIIAGIWGIGYKVPSDITSGLQILMIGFAVLSTMMGLAAAGIAVSIKQGRAVMFSLGMILLALTTAIVSYGVTTGLITIPS